MIGIDYDGTWAAYPSLWSDFAGLCQARGIALIVVTNRAPDRPIGEALPVPVVYAAGRPKLEAAQLAGYSIAIWIDDYPHLVNFGAGHPITTGMGLP